MGKGEKPKKEHQPYDKIFKENIGSIFLPLVEKQLNVRIQKTEELKDKIQTTLQKEADFLRIVTTNFGDTFIVHLEFQVADEVDMVHRMHEYYAMLRKKFKFPVKQFVYYLGEEESTMRTQLKYDEIYRGFSMWSLHQEGYERFLTSEIPEEIILALLADFGKQDAEIIAQKVIQRLLQLKTDKSALEKYIRQMVLLARLRHNLPNALQKQLSTMALTYNTDQMEQDFFYHVGMEKGIEKMAINCILNGMNEVETAKLTELPLEEVKRIANLLRQEGRL